jgi:uncharacterized membrane protein YdjX (TVP38/TMEM64 family)
MNDRIRQLHPIINPAAKMSLPYKIIIIIFLIIFPISFSAMSIHAYTHGATDITLNRLAIITMISTIPFMISIFIIFNRYPRIPSAVGLWTKRHPFIFIGVVMPVAIIIGSYIMVHFRR